MAETSDLSHELDSCEALKNRANCEACHHYCDELLKLGRVTFGNHQIVPVPEAKEDSALLPSANAVQNGSFRVNSTQSHIACMT